MRRCYRWKFIGSMMKDRLLSAPSDVTVFMCYSLFPNLL